MASLTFDDGPDAYWTPRVLDELASLDVRATFFVMAARACRRPALVARTRAEGHEVQLHCLRHLRHTESSRRRIQRDTRSALRLLKPLGVRPHRWRPPWGARASWTTDIARAHDLRLAGWTVDTQDWSGLSADTMLSRTASGAAPEAVVLMHDGIGPGARRHDCRQTAALIAPLVDQLRACGATIEPLGDRPAALP